jgi:TolB-like protein
MKPKLLAALAAASCLVGCSTTHLQDEDERAVFDRTQDLGSKLAAELSHRNPKAVVVVTSFQTANDLNQTDGFGRIAAEQVAGCLAKRGLCVVEVRMRTPGDPPARNSETPDEFALSRDAKKIALEAKADYVVTGVYAHGKFNSIIALKAIDTNGVVQVSCNYTVPATVSFDWDRSTLLKAEQAR